MTSENKMREAQEALEFILDMSASSAGNIGGEEQVEHCGNIIRAALHSVEAEKEPEWIRCADRLPTESDEDFNGRVWYEFDGDITYATAEFVSGFGAGYPGANWKSTGLRRPAPPEHKPE